MNVGTTDLDRVRERLQSAPTVRRCGKLAEANGTLLRATGIEARVGELCVIGDRESENALQAEVVGFANGQLLLTPLGTLDGLSPSAPVTPSRERASVSVGPALLGRVVDADGRPIDGGIAPSCSERIALDAGPPSPMTRQPIDRALTTGVRSIDAFVTFGVGQRVGLFAVAGAGKSTLLGMLARNCRADVNVVALVGERGREVGEFVRDQLGPSLPRTVVVVATSDQPALQRARALTTATAIAEHFRDQGRHVLFLADSLTRYARALRDIGLAAGQPPTRRGYPPSVFSQLPRVLERTGNGARGAITAIYTVLVEDEETPDPIAEEVRSILDGHVVLSRELAASGYYPAVDVLASASRVMDRVVDPAHAQLASRARQLMARHAEVELLVQLGEYEPGRDEVADAALAAVPKLNAWLRQPPDQRSGFADTVGALREALDR